jgi:hypothetical protein
VATLVSSKRSKEAAMVRMFVRHNVRDYEAWRRVYDAFAPQQKAHGVREESVYQSVENPNDVTVTNDFDDLMAAHAFLAAREVQEAIKDAGVVGDPQVWFTVER